MLTSELQRWAKVVEQTGVKMDRVPRAPRARAPIGSASVAFGLL